LPFRFVLSQPQSTFEIIHAAQPRLVLWDENVEHVTLLWLELAALLENEAREYS
jgi:hypothetical protein